MASNKSFISLPSSPKLGASSSPLIGGGTKLSAAPKLKKSSFSFRPVGKSSLVDTISVAPPGQANMEAISESLIETNRILVEIQNQLAMDFAYRVAQEKEESNLLKKQESNKKFSAKEKGLEFSNILKSIETVTKTITKPFTSIFDKIKNVLGILTAGVLTNAVFEWLKDEENRKKVDKFFKILTKNWKLLAGILGTAFIVKSILDLGGAFLVIKGILGILTAKPVLIALTALAALKLGEMVGRPIFEAEMERQNMVREQLQKEGYDAGTAQEIIDKTPVLGVDGPLFQGAGDAINPTAIPGDFDFSRNRFNLGGLVPGEGSSDTVPSMLTPGEYVIKKSIVNKFGENTFKAINNGNNIMQGDKITLSPVLMQANNNYKLFASSGKRRVEFYDLRTMKKETPKKSSPTPQPPATNVPELTAVHNDSDRLSYMSAYGVR